MFIYSASRGKSEDSLSDAFEFIDTLPNVQEGSNILTAFQKIFQKPSDPEHPRQVSLHLKGQCSFFEY